MKKMNSKVLTLQQSPLLLCVFIGLGANRGAQTFPVGEEKGLLERGGL